MNYEPENITPENLVAVTEWALREFQRVSASIKALTLGHLDKTYVAPSKPRDGDIRYADGTQWNPGGGEGIYARIAGAWIKL